MNELSTEAKVVIATLELIASHRANIASRQQANPSPDTSEALNQARIEMLQERVDELLSVLSKDYEVEYNGTTTTVLKQGKKWLEHTDWTEHTLE